VSDQRRDSRLSLRVWITNGPHNNTRDYEAPDAGRTFDCPGIRSQLARRSSSERAVCRKSHQAPTSRWETLFSDRREGTREARRARILATQKTLAYSHSKPQATSVVPKDYAPQFNLLVGQANHCHKKEPQAGYACLGLRGTRCLNWASSRAATGCRGTGVAARSANGPGSSGFRSESKVHIRHMRRSEAPCWF
jgi:hypothetical protein